MIRAVEADDADAAAALEHVPTRALQAMVDQLVCSRASTLLLNGYSGFAQVVAARLAMAAPPTPRQKPLGWLRDLGEVRFLLSHCNQISFFLTATLNCCFSRPVCHS